MEVCFNAVTNSILAKTRTRNCTYANMQKISTKIDIQQSCKLSRRFQTKFKPYGAAERTKCKREFSPLCASAKAWLPRTVVHFSPCCLGKSRDRKQKCSTHRGIIWLSRAHKNTYFHQVISRYDTEIRTSRYERLGMNAQKEITPV